MIIYSHKDEKVYLAFIVIVKSYAVYWHPVDEFKQFILELHKYIYINVYNFFHLYPNSFLFHISLSSVDYIIYLL